MSPHRLGAAAAAPQHGAGAGGDLGRLDRFDQVVVSAFVQPGDALLKAVTRCQDQHRHAFGAGAPARQPVQAWLAAVFALGLLFGSVQLARGAHYPSHTLWTAWICWAVGAAAWHAARRSRVISGH